MVFVQKQCKTDPAVERGIENGFAFQLDPGELSAGKWLWVMLIMDLETGRRKETPVFRDDVTGMEVTK